MLPRVLLIDDSPQMHRLVDAWLRSDPVELLHANDGKSGLEVAQTTPVDMVLLDVDMPDVSGFDVCRQFKSDPSLSAVPIVFLTGASSPEDRVAGLNLGAVDYIVKPFHPAEFQARVRATLRTKQLVDLLRERAQIDGLTALRNRAFLDDRLGGELASLARRPGTLSCLMIDLDHFKQINDRHGHLVGDEVLRAVAGVLVENTRVEDVVTRYGGEEFVMLTPGVSLEGALSLAERLRVGIERVEVRRVAGTVRVTCSVGVAEYDSDAPTELLRRADAAMYEAKRTGRNRVCAYDASIALRRVESHAA